MVKKLGRAVGASLIWSDSTAAGYPDQALERAHEAISRGRAQLPVHLGGSLNYGGQIPICRGDAPTVLEWAEECLGFAERLGLEFHIGFAKVNRGWAYARLGRAEEGITEIRDGIPKWRASGFESWAARHLILLSEVSIEAGRLEDAIALSDEALISIRETGERQFESYALIAKGDALRAMDREGEAARCFLDAIDVAHSQSAKSWELRAATRLGRGRGQVTPLPPAQIPTLMVPVFMAMRKNRARRGAT